MDAKEARQKAEEILTNDINSEYSKIKAYILQAVKGGKFQCSWDDYITPVVKEKLTKEGYKVGDSTSFRNETQTSINW